MTRFIRTFLFVILMIAFAGVFVFIFDKNFSLVLKSSTNEKESNVIEKKIFGNSEKGKVIEGYVVGAGENVILLFGAIHGNEMGTAELLRQLILEIALDPSLVSPKNKLIVIPVANPDGYFDRTDNLNANKVNLNLNFATSDWKKYGPEGNYAGPEPFSEIESQVVKQVVEQYKPSMMVSFHSHGNLVSPEKIVSSVALAQWYSKKSGYKYFDEWDYAGTATKWFEETTGNPAITVELSADLQSDWEINRKVLFELIAGENF